MKHALILSWNWPVLSMKVKFLAQGNNGSLWWDSNSQLIGIHCIKIKWSVRPCIKIKHELPWRVVSNWLLSSTVHITAIVIVRLDVHVLCLWPSLHRRSSNIEIAVLSVETQVWNTQTHARLMVGTLAYFPYVLIHLCS